MTRTARDAGLMLGAMAGYDRHDPTSVDVPVPDFTAGIDGGVSGFRLARCPDLHYLEVDAAVARALDDAADVLGHLGAKLETVRRAAQSPAESDVPEPPADDDED